MFFESLARSGLYGMKMMTSDVYLGLETAMKVVLAGVPWIRCHVHLQRNKKENKNEQLFTNEESFLRLASAIMMEQSE
jgi:transposase-like protein